MIPPLIHSARRLGAIVLVFVLATSVRAADHAEVVVEHFRSEIEPILEANCYACHGYGSSEGQITLDEFDDADSILETNLWLKVLQNVRAGIMPPPSEADPLPAEDLARLEQWVKRDVFRIDPNDPDPGHVTLRRLNRNEYERTIRDLMGYEYKADQFFPPDDTGHGFDNIGDVLSTSSILVEKYMHAASQIVRAVVPGVTRAPAVRELSGAEFLGAPHNRINCETYDTYPRTIRIDKPGTYAVRVVFDVYCHAFYTEHQVQVSFAAEGEELHSAAYGYQGSDDAVPIAINFTRQWQPGEKELTFTISPADPNEEKPKKVPLTMRVLSVRVEGPLEEEHWVNPPGYEKYFPRPDPPTDAEERRQYAREILRPFLDRAYRRPVDEPTLERLVALAESVYTLPDATFEQGIQQAMTAALTSRRFLFRIEQEAPGQEDMRYPLIDEYSLASRLSYLLWSSMPDDELFDLARRGELRNNLEAQVKRMLADPKSSAFVENFVGQWLRTREIETVDIDARLVLARDAGVEAEELAFREALFSRALAARIKAEMEELARLRKEKEGAAAADESGEKPAEDAKDDAEQQQPAPQPEQASASLPKRVNLPNVNLDEKMRADMRKETEAYFAHILHENRPLLELIDSNYTFLNERLARHYGIEGVKGDEFRKVIVPPESHRGGILTHAGILMLTSQSTRTSAVKRGVYVLDNLLGTPSPPAPPNIPALEEAEESLAGREPTLRETLELHRRNPVCASCHNRMDPIGLALENFNALGMWRTEERNQPINVEGELASGEVLKSVDDLRKALVQGRRTDYYRCVTEKLMIYALGRGLEYYDVEAIDRIVERLQANDGHAMELLMGVIESAPFQKRRRSAHASADAT